MEIKFDKFEKIINKKLKTNQFLLAVSILIGLIIFYFNRNHSLWAILFIAIGSLSLPNINNCKQDLADFRAGKLKDIEGLVLDVFPEKNSVNNSNWIIFLESRKKLKEFVVSEKPEIDVDSVVKIYHTTKMGIPVKIEIVTQKS